MECTFKKMDPCLKGSVFESIDGMIYYNSSTSLHHANNEFYGKLIIVSAKKEFLFCRSLTNKFKRIYIYKKHFTGYIIDGTLQFKI